MSLSGVECAVVAAVAGLTGRQGFPPTRAEVAAALGWTSTGTAHWYVRRLVDAGVLCVEPHQPRSLWPEPVPAPTVLDATGCPICKAGDAS